MKTRMNMSILSASRTDSSCGEPASVNRAARSRSTRKTPPSGAFAANPFGGLAKPDQGARRSLSLSLFLSLSASKFNEGKISDATRRLTRNLIQRLNFGFSIAFVVRIVVNIDVYIGTMRRNDSGQIVLLQFFITLAHFGWNFVQLFFRFDRTTE